MSEKNLSRRQFLFGSATLVGTAMVAPIADRWLEAAVKRTASDLVPLGKSGVKISRLGFGTGSIGGEVQRALGQENFTRLIRYAYERGLTYIDTADMYKTHQMVREAIKGLPREKLFIQTKMWWSPENIAKPLNTLDRYRKELDTDYVDSLLIHCNMKPTWPQDLRPMMDKFQEAQEKKLIRLRGTSCHGLPALRAATGTDWPQVQLARVNPQGHVVDGPKPDDEYAQMDAAAQEIRAMHKKGRGVIGMKLIGNGDFRNKEDRVKAMQYAMNCGFVDAVVVGFKSTAEIDEAIENVNNALAG